MKGKAHVNTALDSEEKKYLDAALLVHPSDTHKVLDPNSDELSETDTEGESLTDSLQGDHDEDGKLLPVAAVALDEALLDHVPFSPPSLFFSFPQTLCQTWLR